MAMSSLCTTCLVAAWAIQVVLCVCGRDDLGKFRNFLSIVDIVGQSRLQIRWVLWLLLAQNFHFDIGEGGRNKQ